MIRKHSTDCGICLCCMQARPHLAHSFSGVPGTSLVTLSESAEFEKEVLLVPVIESSGLSTGGKCIETRHLLG